MKFYTLHDALMVLPKLAGLGLRTIEIYKVCKLSRVLPYSNIHLKTVNSGIVTQDFS